MKTKDNCQAEETVSPIIKWVTYRNRCEIEKVERIKETEKFVWHTRWGRNPSRSNKCSQYENYHDSWEDAKAYLMHKAQQQVESARRSLESANSYFGNVKGLRKPEGEKP